MARNETLDVGLCMKCNQAESKPGSAPPSSRICSNSKKRGDSHSNGWVEEVIDKKRTGWRLPSCLTPFSTRRKLCLLGLCCKSQFTLPRGNFHEHTIDQGRCRDFQKQRWNIQERPPSTSGSGLKPKLLDQVCQAIRSRHLSPRTEQSYVGWIKRYIFFTGNAIPWRWGKVRSAPFLPFSPWRDTSAPQPKHRRSVRSCSCTRLF
jgi:hypothetical protein